MKDVNQSLLYFNLTVVNRTKTLYAVNLNDLSTQNTSAFVVGIIRGEPSRVYQRYTNKQFEI